MAIISRAHFLVGHDFGREIFFSLFVSQNSGGLCGGQGGNRL